MIMEMSPNDIPRSQLPRRRRRSKMQIFKEAYLPTIILAVTIVLIIVFIIGAAVGSSDPEQTDPNPSGNGSTASTPAKPGPDVTEPTVSPELTREAAQLLAQAQQQANNYDYDAALATLAQFSGDMEQFPALINAYQEYTTIKMNMVSWKASDVPNLSFNLLIADPERAFVDPEYAKSYKNNFVTVSEFTAILQQLYENGYVLVSLSDFYREEFNASTGRHVFTETEIQLPAGKKPLMITETHANYYTYMTDSNGDGKPDAGADGFASRLCHDENGFYNEFVKADGTISTGSYDIVPLLEDFIAANPDFSYKGARAIIAFSGYDGVLGYRINSSRLGAAALQAERDGAATIIEALKTAGYDLACYTYGNYHYGDMAPKRVQEDIQDWLNEIAPWVGSIDILVYARDADIAGAESYAGNAKFNVLYNAGFKYFMGVGNTAWNQVDDQYVRHNRLCVTGANLLKNAALYAEFFDAESVLDSARK